MGAEHSQQRVDVVGHENFVSRDFGLVGNSNEESTNTGTGAAAAITSHTRPSLLGKQKGSSSNGTGVSSVSNTNVNTKSKELESNTVLTTSCEISRPPSPPLSVCSDLPYVSYTDRPIGDSPKIRNKPNYVSIASSRVTIAGVRKSHPSGVKPKRPQSTASCHSIVIVKPGTRDPDYDIDRDLLRLRNIPQFLPVLRESISSATFTRDTEILERLHSQHLVNICSRMQSHLNLCAAHTAMEQNRLVERTKAVSNSITTLFATFVDMQKTYAAYAEQFAKIRTVSQQLSRCNSLLNENIASLEAINNYLDHDDRLNPFVWRTDDKLRGEAEGAVGCDNGRLWRM